MTKQAWFCPACQRHHAPHCDTCPKPVDLIGKEFMPRIPATTPNWGTADPCAGCSGVCGNAFCPKRMVITSAAALTAARAVH